MPPAAEPRDVARDASLDERMPLVGAALAPRAAAEGGVIGIEELGKYFGFRRFHVFLLLSMCLVGLPAPTLAGPMPYFLDEVQAEFGLSLAHSTLAATSLLLGSMPGVLIFGHISDRWGRKVCLTSCVTLIGVGSVLHLAIPPGGLGRTGGFACLVGLRAVLGIAYGGLYLMVVPYIIEFMPDHGRGAAATAYNMGWPLGHWLGIIVVQTFHRPPAVGWRTILAVTPLLPSLVALACLVLAPESPRWLLVNGHEDAAQKVLDKVFASPPVYGHACVGPAPKVQLKREPSAKALGFRDILSDLFSPGLRQVTIVTCLLYAILAGVGNSFWALGPGIMERVVRKPVGLSVFRDAEYFRIAGTLTSVAVVDVLGRRLLLSMSFAAIGAIFLLFLAGPTRTEAVDLFFLKMVFDGILWATVPAYMSEAFPTAFRASAVGVAASLGRLTSVFFPLLAGALMHRGEATAALLFFLGAYAVATLLAFMIPQETARQALRDERPSASWPAV